MTVHIVGTCGNCGGPVEVPVVWHGIYPPTPTCRSCGSTPKEAFGRRLPMNPTPKRNDRWSYIVLDDEAFEEAVQNLQNPSPPTASIMRGAELIRSLYGRK